MIQNLLLIFVGYLFGALKLYASYIFIQKFLHSDTYTIEFYVYGVILLFFISTDAVRLKELVKGHFGKS
jgi:hypothetical protein